MALVVDPSGERVSPWRTAIAGALAGSTLAALVMGPTWAQLARTWRAEAAFQWCWLVVPAVLYGLLQRLRLRPRAGAARPEPDLRGLWAAIPAALLWWACDLMNITVGQELALVIALHGIARSALGRTVYRECFATLAMLFLMVPSADVLQPVLREITLRGIELFAAAAGLPHRVDGYEIAIGDQYYIVIDECSGLAPVTLSMFLGFFFGTLLYRSIWRVLALAAFASLLGIASNLARVDAIVWIDWLRGSQMDLMAHADIQWLSVVLVLGLLLLVLGRLRGDRRTSSSASAQAGRARRRDRFAPWVVGVSIPLAVWCLNGVGRTVSEGATRNVRTAQAFPATLAGGTRADGGHDWTADGDGATAASIAMYRQARRRIEAVVVRTLSPAAKLPRWQVPATPSGRWHDVQTRQGTHCDRQGCDVFSRTVLQGGAELGQRATLEATYCTAGRMTDSLLRARVAHAWARLTGAVDAPRSVVVVVDGDGLSASEAVEALRALCRGG